jgi:hypothetical protein
MRRTVRSLRYWMIKRGEVPYGYEFPENFPYGQPGFPPPFGD